MPDAGAILVDRRQASCMCCGWSGSAKNDGHGNYSCLDCGCYFDDDDEDIEEEE